MHHSKQLLAHISSPVILGSVLLVVVGSGIAWGYVTMTRIEALGGDIVALRAELASTTALLGANIEETHSSLSSALSAEKESLEAKLGDFEENVESISNTVGTLEKLSRTDPELLQKYSKVFFLNEHYAPERLVAIPQEIVYSETRPEKIHAAVFPHLEDLFDGAMRDGVELYVKSAFRSFEEQRSLKGQYSVTYGAGTANQFSADQGYSEHQLGTTVDFITTGTGGALPGFDKTAAYEWLLLNAYRFGFILSYPVNNGYYIFEPWHWRFVGEELADELHDSGRHFYELDQREIDEYLISIFD